MLTVGACDMPARHQTLRDAIAWSYHLLEADEQTLFRYLGIFVGGCALEAVAAVLSSELRVLSSDTSELSTQHSELVILEGLAALVDKSMLRQEEAGGVPRFVMLEMMREYALEQLASNGETGTVGGRHADFFLALVEAAEPMLQGEQQRLWLERLEDEHDNLRTALRWTLDSGAADKALRFSAVLWRFWRVRGYLSEGRYWLDAALAMSAGQPAPTLARALNGAGLLARDQGDYQQAYALHQEGLALYQELGDQQGIAESLDNLGHVASAQGEYVQALAFFERSLMLYSALGSKQQMASTLIGMANIAWSQEDSQRTEALFQQSLALGREINDRENVAWSLAGLGTVALNQSDVSKAIGLFEEGLALFHDISHNRGIAWMLHNLGNAARARGDYAQAHTRYEESLALQRNVGDKQGIALALYHLGLTAQCEGDDVQAHAYYTESLALFRELDNTRHIALILKSLGDIALTQSNTE
jgi:predicted ATPase